MNRQLLSALLLVSATVLAGCGAIGGAPSPSAPTGASTTPTDTTTTTPTEIPSPTPEDGVTVYGDLPVNATLVWERLETMLGSEYDAPTVSVIDAGLAEIGPFARALGMSEGKEGFYSDAVGGRYRHKYDRIGILLQNGSREEITRVLVHEYAHAIQHRTGFMDRAREHGGARVNRASTEGSAVYIEDAYTRTYLGFSAIERRCSEYRERSAYARYLERKYCFGGRYFRAQFDSPTAMLASNATFPNTTEQLLHPGSTDQPATLTVVDETPTGWYTPVSFTRRGELFVRTVLGTELSEERAIEAASGWGNDRLVTATGDTEGYVWVLRWDTGADAAEFRTAFGDYLDARGEQTADGWGVDDDRYRLSSVDNRTVAVVTGNETFVDRVSVTATGRNVTVSAEP